LQVSIVPSDVAGHTVVHATVKILRDPFFRLFIYENHVDWRMISPYWQPAFRYRIPHE
jgi:hypothetical protein